VEIVGTNFTISLGSWRLRLVFCVEDTDELPMPKPPIPHRMRVVPEDQYAK
jgi:hypothetical protein